MEARARAVPLALTVLFLTAALAPLGQASFQSGDSSLASMLEHVPADPTTLDSVTAVVSYQGYGHGTAVPERPYSEFPLHGEGFAWLTTGGLGNILLPSLLGSYRGTTQGDETVDDKDMTRLAFDFTPAPGINCLRFDFQFVTQEEPGRKGVDGRWFEDGFVAQMGPAPLSFEEFGGTNAPGNFAVDGDGNPISEYATGFAALGSTAGMPWGNQQAWRDGEYGYQPPEHIRYATPILRAQTPVEPGVPQTLTLSLYERYDVWYDSIVFFDNMVLEAVPEGGCEAGTSDPNANTPPTAVASASHTLANLGESVTFDGSGSSDPEDGGITSYEWRHEGLIVGTTDTYTGSFTDLATQCLELTVYDSQGLTATDDVCVDMTDELDVRVQATQRYYRFYGQPVIDVDVRYLSGTPIEDADVVMNVDYQSNTGAVNIVLENTPCRSWRSVEQTDALGEAEFEVPRLFLNRCWQVFPSVAEVPTEIPLLAGKYRASGSVSFEGNQGIDSDVYSINIV
ncbi:MAG: PKD domain-containing protein [Thermoplasmatota archaeon]